MEKIGRIRKEDKNLGEKGFRDVQRGWPLRRSGTFALDAKGRGTNEKTLFFHLSSPYPLSFLILLSVPIFFLSFLILSYPVIRASSLSCSLVLLKG